MKSSPTFSGASSGAFAGDSSGSIVARAWQNRWAFAVPVATLVLVATLWAVHLPDTFTATSVVGVRPILPEQIGSGLPQAGPEEREAVLATLSERLFADELVGVAASRLVPEQPSADAEVLDRVRKRLTFERVGKSAFTLSVEDVDPARAAGTVNDLVDAFLASERTERLRRAQGTRDFAEREAGETRKAYEDALARLEAGRRRHPEVLPEHKDAIAEESRQLQAQVAVQDGLVATARQRLDALDREIAGNATAPTPGEVRAPTTEEEGLRLELAEQQRSLGVAEKEHADARARYTDRHPEVERTRLAVEAQRLATQRTTRALAEARSRGEAEHAARRSDADRRRRGGLVTLRDEARGEAERAAAQASALRGRLDALRGRLAQMPAVEAELRPLQRDVEDAARRLETREKEAALARAAADFYGRARPEDVSGFRVDRVAVPPPHATGPGRWRFVATALGLGLLAGWGWISLRRRKRADVVGGPQDLVDLLPGATIVAVPSLGEGRPNRRGRALLEVCCVAWVAVAIATSAMAYAARKGWVEAPSWSRAFLEGSR